MGTRPSRAAQRAALREAIDAAPHPVPCEGLADEFTSDDPTVMEQAAPLCAGCPALAPCRSLFHAETWGVWGGVVVCEHASKRRTIDVLADPDEVAA